MAARNPFDLSARRATGAAEAPHLAREWTEADQAQKLAGYIEVSPAFWEYIRVGSHVRYYSAAGEFRVGGFVAENPTARPEPGSPEPAKKMIAFKNGFDAQAKRWATNYEDISRIFVKADAPLVELKHDFDSAIRQINANMQKLATHIVGLREGR